ncbi:hypothetical protein MOV3098_02840, partial [Mesomycoplasma ovipneumoniae]
MIKILKNYQEAIKIAKQPAFWNTLDNENKSQVPFVDKNFSKISTLSDLVFAFYTQAALANNWNEYQDSGARPSIKFEIEEDNGASKDQGNIIGLKIKYVVGFDDNAGKFVDDVIQSSPQTIFVRTSGQSEAEVKQKNNLDQMIEDAPLSSQSLILDAEKFGHLQILANSIYDKKKPAPEPETPRQDSGIRWIDDKVPGQPRPGVKRPEINQDEFFKGKL